MCELSSYCIQPRFFLEARMYHAQFATDVDADGDLDFIVMNLDGGLHLLLNDLETEHHSLGFSFTNDWAGASMRVSLSDGTEHYEVVQSSNGTRYNRGLWRRVGLVKGSLLTGWKFDILVWDVEIYWALSRVKVGLTLIDPLHVHCRTSIRWIDSRHLQPPSPIGYFSSLESRWHSYSHRYWLHRIKSRDVSAHRFRKA